MKTEKYDWLKLWIMIHIIMLVSTFSKGFGCFFWGPWNTDESTSVLHNMSTKQNAEKWFNFPKEFWKFKRRFASFYHLKFFWTMKNLLFKLRISFEKGHFSINRESNNISSCFNRLSWVPNGRHNYTHKKNIINDV